MVSSHRLTKLLIFLVLVFFLTSCSLIYIPKGKEDFSQETARLEKRIQEEKDSSIRSSFHLQLARLYADYKNPKKDYKKALKEFETYLSLAPEWGRKDEIQNWVSILRALDRAENQQIKMREKIDLLTKESTERELELEQQMKNIQKLQMNIERLQESNASLKKTIESLKTLDLDIENKRKRIK
jgi:tetratricopeptide (TPR) repeat protein